MRGQHFHLWNNLLIDIFPMVNIQNDDLILGFIDCIKNTVITKAVAKESFKYAFQGFPYLFRILNEIIFNSFNDFGCSLFIEGFEVI